MCFMLGSATAPAAETLRVMGWQGDVYIDHQQPFIDLVKEKHGIDLKFEFTYAKNDDDFFAALRDGKADIVNPDHQIPKDERFNYIGRKLVLPLNLANIPNYRKLQTEFQNATFWTEGGQVYGVPTSYGFYGLAYNTKLLPEPPTTWNVLWDPKFKGKYVVGKAHYEPNAHVTALALGIPHEKLGDFKTLNTPKFRKKFDELAANAKSFFEGVDQADDLQGLPVAAVWGVAFKELAKRGENWRFATPKEGSPAWILTWLISSKLAEKPQMKTIAEEWLNYLLSDEIQQYNVRDMYVAPITQSVLSKLPPDEIAAFKSDDPTFFQKHGVLFPVLREKDRTGFERLWDKALKQRKP